jgi:hypothetical protein
MAYRSVLYAVCATLKQAASRFLKKFCCKMPPL